MADLSKKKHCRGCRKPWDATLEYFPADRRNLDGLGGRCRECIRAQNRQRYATQEARDWRLQYDQNRRNRRSADYRAAHKTEVRQSFLAWAENNPLRLMLKRARIRARRRGLVCTLTIADLEALWTPACPVLGKLYDLSLEGPLDDSPSLDRLNPAEPYVASNVAIISYRANRLKNNGSAEEHRRIGERLQTRPLIVPAVLSPVEHQECLITLQSTRSRAQRRGVDFQLTVDDMPGLPDRCPYLGLTLGRNLVRPGDSSPSLDRINSQLGYLRGNVEWVSLRANRLKGDGTAEEHLRIAEWLETVQPFAGAVAGATGACSS